MAEQKRSWIKPRLAVLAPIIGAVTPALRLLTGPAIRRICGERLSPARNTLFSPSDLQLRPASHRCSRRRRPSQVLARLIVFPSPRRRVQPLLALREHRGREERQHSDWSDPPFGR